MPELFEIGFAVDKDTLAAIPLATLVRHAGKVVTHRQLLKEVWGPLHVEEGHYLRVYMRQLRNKLEKSPANPKYLVTELGVGYRLRTEDN